MLTSVSPAPRTVPEMKYSVLNEWVKEEQKVLEGEWSGIENLTEKIDFGTL